MKPVRRMRLILALTVLGLALPGFAQSPPASQPEQVLHSSDLSRILPGSVFFRGQSATTQLRNSGGVRFADGYLMFAALVDNSGYSTGVQQKYQAYLITEVPLNIEGHHLAPGAYGAGILRSGASPRFVIQDLGAHDLLQTPAKHDAAIRHPVPLQVTALVNPGTYRLYIGRNYVEFKRAK